MSIHDMRSRTTTSFLSSGKPEPAPGMPASKLLRKSVAAGTQSRARKQADSGQVNDLPCPLPHGRGSVGALRHGHFHASSSPAQRDEALLLERSRWPLAAVLIAMVALSISCSGPGSETSAASPQEQVSQPSLFAVPENQLAHLRIEPVEKTDWTITLRATGTVDWNNDRTAPAIAQVSGPITKIMVDTGSMVDVNTPLLIVSSPDITNGIAAYRKAKNRQDLETRALERSRDLLVHRAIAQKDLESVQADYNDATTDLQNALQALRIFGITAPEIDAAERQGVPINPELAVRSPLKGIVVQKLIFPGQLIQAGATTCFLISDPSTVWVQGHIYEKDLNSVHIGDQAEVTNAASSTILKGTVTYIGAMIDPATRTTPVRITTANPGDQLRKDQFVDLVIHTKARKSVLSVPASAVLYDASNLPFVYVQVDAARFAQRQITVGAQDGGRIEVLSGLKESEKVVADGAIFLQFENSYQR